MLTMYDGRMNLTAQVAAELRKHLGDKIYDTVIPRSIRLTEAPSHGLPGVIYDKNLVRTVTVTVKDNGDGTLEIGRAHV